MILGLGYWLHFSELDSVDHVKIELLNSAVNTHKYWPHRLKSVCWAENISKKTLFFSPQPTDQTPKVFHETVLTSEETSTVNWTLSPITLLKSIILLSQHRRWVCMSLLYVCLNEARSHYVYPNMMAMHIYAPFSHYFPWIYMGLKAL